MPINRKIPAFCAVPFIVAAAAAETDYSGYVQFNGVDKMGSSSWRSKGYWSDQSVPSPDKNYFVPQGKELWFQRDSNADAKRIWQGGKLVIAGILHTVVNASSESFRTLRDDELSRFGEYRTKRLALEAWERMKL